MDAHFGPWALTLSRPIYANVDSPNLGFPYFNFLGGYQLKRTPCSILEVHCFIPWHLMGFLSASEQLDFFLCFLKGRPYLHQTCDICQMRPKYLHIYNPDVHCVTAMLSRFRSWVWEFGGELFNPGCWLQVDSTAATSFHSPNKSFTWHWSMIITMPRGGW